VSRARPARGAIVLAGGRSTRMGRDKASLPFGDGTLLSRVVLALARVVPEVVLVARKDQRLPPLPALPAGVEVRVAHDEVEGKGPLGGLVPGLRAATAECAYLSSCDVPFLSDAFVRRMFDALGGKDVAIPEAEGHLHPLSAVYRKDAVLPHVEALLREDRLRPVFLLERVPHAAVPASALREVDPELLSLANLNTPEAYEAALARLARRPGP
jgi:molybdopterin-guanine dinucleotide biosynthesis protein A